MILKSKEATGFFLCGCLFLFAAYLLLQGRGVAKHPTIFRVTPEIVYQGYPLIQEITIHGEHFQSDIELFVDDNQLVSYTVADENTITFKLPEVLWEIGSHEIYLKDRQGRLGGKNSNSAMLKVEKIDAIFPEIKNVHDEEISAVSRMLTVEGTNFSDSADLFINGKVQSAIVTWSNDAISIKISTPEFILDNELVLQIVNRNDATICSKEYVLENSGKANTNKAFYSNTDYFRNGYLVAHAFGGYGGKTYTNSKEAFLQNYAAGHRIFEVDFQMTSDHVLVTMHNQEEMIGTVKEEQDKKSYTILTIDELCEMMLEYNDIYIITDTKYYNNFDATSATFDYMTRAIKSYDSKLFERFIVQVYNQQMYYFMINRYPFKSYIYILYASSDSNDEVLEFIEKTKIPAVTMWADRATKDFVESLNSLGAVTFAHTVNDVSKINSLMQNGVYGIYTDFVTYDELPYNREVRYSAFKNLSGENIASRDFFLDYLSRISDPDNTYIILASDINSTTVKDFQSYGFMELVDEVPQKNYLSVVKGNQIIYEAASNEKLEYIWFDGGVSYSAVSDFDNLQLPCSAQISGREMSVQKANINVISYDSVDKKLASSDSFDPANNYTRTPYDTRYVQNRNSFIAYLEKLKSHKTDYTILFSVCDEGSAALNDLTQQKLYDLGLKENMQGKSRYGYAAIIDDGKVNFEKSSPDCIAYNVMVDDWFIQLQSAGYDAGNISSIKINGIEHSKNRRGMNIVIFDKLIGAVVDSVCFDTYLDFDTYR